MPERPDFIQKQVEFAAYIRDPDNNPAPEGIEDRRLAVYRELFFNNLLKLLSGTFPVLKTLHDPVRWRAMVRDFMVSHRAQTPYFLKIPEEFLAFLQNEYEAQADDFPFLLELAHYEWAELAMSVSEDSNEDLDVNPEGDLLEGVPVKSRLAALFAYSFPVHRISKDYVPTEPGEQATFLVIYRRDDDELGFMELNPVTAQLLASIDNNRDATGRELLTQLAADVGYDDIDAMLAHGKAAMEEMREHEILLGTRRST